MFQSARSFKNEAFRTSGRLGQGREAFPILKLTKPRLGSSSVLLSLCGLHEITQTGEAKGHTLCPFNEVVWPGDWLAINCYLEAALVSRQTPG